MKFFKIHNKIYIIILKIYKVKKKKKLKIQTINFTL